MWFRLSTAEFTTNIGTMNTWSITRVLGTGVSYSGNTSVDKGASFSATVTLTDTENYKVKSYTVTMDDVDITADAVEVVIEEVSWTITINEVTGSVKITFVTENINTGEEDIGGTYTITYVCKDSSGTTLKTTTETGVAAGTSRTFTTSGAPAISGYTCTSVSPTSATINSNITVTYTYTANVVGEIVAFADCPWGTVQQVLSDGAVNASNQWVHNGQVWFSVGDEKPITLTDGTSMTVQIADFNHDVDENGNTVAATFVTKELYPETHIMNPANDVDTGGTNQGGWPVCELRTWMNDEVYVLLPSELQNVITPVTKKSTAGYKSTEIVSSVDNLFTLAEAEVVSGVSSGEGTLYPIFTNDATSRMKCVANNTVAMSNWWLRSPVTSTTTSFKRINTSGNASSGASTQTYCVPLAFCIGGN